MSISSRVIADEKSAPPTVSVIIPTYNRAYLIGRSITSILSQTYKHFEIIVVDDASQDNTEEIVEAFDDPRISFIRHDENSGGAAARNTGIRAVQGEYVAFLDSDDEWLPEKLELQINKLRLLPEDYGLVYTPILVVDAGLKFTRRADFVCHRGDVSKQLAGGWCPSITSSVLMRTAHVKRIGGFDERFPSFQDYDFWMSLSVNCKFDYVNEYLTIVHHHAGPRVAVDYEPRLKGLDLFFNKWEERITDELGPDGLVLLKKKYLVMAHRNTMLRSSCRKEVLANLIMAAHTDLHFGIRFWVKSILLLVGGQQVLGFFIRIKHSIGERV